MEGNLMCVDMCSCLLCALSSTLACLSARRRFSARTVDLAVLDAFVSGTCVVLGCV